MPTKTTAVAVTCKVCQKVETIDPGDLDNQHWAKGWTFEDRDDGTPEGGFWLCPEDKA